MAVWAVLTASLTFSCAGPTTAQRRSMIKDRLYCMDFLLGQWHRDKLQEAEDIPHMIQINRQHAIGVSFIRDIVWFVDNNKIKRAVFWLNELETWFMELEPRIVTLACDPQIVKAYDVPSECRKTVCVFP